MSQDSQIQVEARKWVDSLERKWRLQILSKRTRVNRETGERTELPLRIRRFVEGIPYAYVTEAMRYLISLAPYRGVIYNGNTVEGEFIPTVTSWTRDDNDTVNGTSRTDGTYTLVQDLVDKDYIDRYLLGTARSCTEEESTEWTWDASSIASIPETGSLQGVTYAIRSVSRNEDGTFNYALVRRVAKTQHTPRVLIRETADMKVESMAWDNLYGEPFDFTDHDGVDVVVPQSSVLPPSDTYPGVRTEVQVSKNADCTYKVQVIIYTDAMANSTEFVGGRACTEETTYTYRWYVDEIEELTQSQGVSSAIQNLRKEDSGAYSYTVVTRRALTQDTGDLVQADTAGERVLVRTLNNVYGSPDTAWYDHSGATLTVPAPTGSAGLRVEVQSTPNQDCTYRIVVTTTQSKQLVSAQDSTHTQFDGEHTEQVQGRLLPLGVAPDASGGVIKSYESQKQPDGRFRTTEKTKVERAVSESSKTVSVGRRGTRVVTVDTNQSAPAPATSIGIGGSVRVDKTPGGLYNNTVTMWSQEQKVDAAESCTEDAFRHRDSRTVSGMQEMPDHDAGDHVEGSGEGGLVISRQTDMDEEGSISQTTVKDQEKFAPTSEESWQVGLTGVTRTVKHRHVSPTAGGDYFGTIPLYTTGSVGKSLKRELTPGGLYNVTITEPMRGINAGLDTGSGCSKTAFIHVDSTTRVTADKPADTHVPDASNGVYHTKDVQINSDGTFTTSSKTNTEVNEPNAEVSHRRHLRGIVTTRTDRNVGGVGVSDLQVKPTAIGESVAWRMTDGKLYDKTTTSIELDNRTVDRAFCGESLTEHVHENVSITKGRIATDGTIYATSGTTESQFRPSHVEEAGIRDGKGTHRTRTADTDEYGFIRVVEKVTQEIPVTEYQKRKTSDAFSVTEQVVDKNQALSESDISELTSTILPIAPDAESHEIVTVTVSRNPGGSCDVTTERVTPTFRTWNHLVDTNWRYRNVVWFRNATVDQYEELYQTHLAAFVGKMQGTRSGDPIRGRPFESQTPSGSDSETSHITLRNAGGWLRDTLGVGNNSEAFGGLNGGGSQLDTTSPSARVPSSYAIDPNITMNSHGLFDGSFTFAASWELESAGQFGTLNALFYGWSYTERTINMAAPRVSASGGMSAVQTIIDRTVYTASGRGRAMMDAKISGYAWLFSGTHITFHPISQVWAITMVTNQTITITGTGAG